MAHWPQYLAIAYLVVAFAVGLIRDAGKYDAFSNVMGGICGYAIIILVLWSGGFWAPLGYAP